MPECKRSEWVWLLLGEYDGDKTILIFDSEAKAKATRLEWFWEDLKDWVDQETQYDDEVSDYEVAKEAWLAKDEQLLLDMWEYHADIFGYFVSITKFKVQ